MNIDIIPATSEHDLQTAELASRVFGESVQLNTDYMRWKYHENPYLTEPCVHVAVAGSKIVGVRGTYGSRWRFGPGESWMMPTAGDLAVDKEFRGLWIAQRLVNAGQAALAARGYAYSLSTSAGPTTRLIRLQAGCRLAARYAYYYLDAAQRFARRYPPEGGGPGPGARLAQLIRNRWRKSINDKPMRKFDKWAKSVTEPFEISATPDHMTLGRLATKFSDDSVYHHVRDEEFYRWRLRDPRHRFRFVYYKPGSVVDGFFIIQQRVAGGPLMISDWATPTFEAWSKLLQLVCSCESDEIHIASTVFSPAYTSQIAECGFAQRTLPGDTLHGEPGILIDSISGADSVTWTLNDQNLLNPAKWDMRMICSDAF